MNVHLIYPLDYSWARIAHVLETLGICVSKDKREAVLTFFSEVSSLSYTEYVETTYITFNALPHGFGIVLFFLSADKYLGEAVLTRNINTIMLLPSRLFIIDPFCKRHYYSTRTNITSVSSANLPSIPVFKLPDDIAPLKCSVCTYLELILHKQLLPDVMQPSSLSLLVWEWIRRYEEAVPKDTIESVRQLGRLVGENLRAQLISETAETRDRVQSHLTVLTNFIRNVLQNGCTNTSMSLGHCTLKEHRLQIVIYVQYRPEAFQMRLGHLLASVCWSFMGSREDTVVCSQDRNHLTISVSPQYQPDAHNNR